MTLFNNSVKENIRIGKSGATDEEVMEAARLANCEEFVKLLSDKYDTYIGENGSELSGGERQRISIASLYERLQFLNGILKINRPGICG